jgi:hypothetical protein
MSISNRERTPASLRALCGQVESCAIVGVMPTDSRLQPALEFVNQNRIAEATRQAMADTKRAKRTRLLSMEDIITFCGKCDFSQAPTWGMPTNHCSLFYNESARRQNVLNGRCPNAQISYRSGVMTAKGFTPKLNNWY